MLPAGRSSRVLIITGFVAMLIGTLDPLEGSVLILAGIALMTAGAGLGKSPQRHVLYKALALTAAGVGLMWGMSAAGGFGGRTGRSNWWALTLLPYPIGWVLALVAAYRLLRRRPDQPPRPAR